MSRRNSAFAIICRRGQVLLVKARGRKRWTLPGGGLKSLESPWAAAIREVREETGLEARLIALAGLYHRADGSLAYVFTARVGWQEIPKGPLHEIAKRRWMPLRKALRRLERAPRERLQDALRRPSLFRASVARLERTSLRFTAG